MSCYRNPLSQKEIEEILYEGIPSDHESACDDNDSDEAFEEQSNVQEEETANVEFDDLSEYDSDDILLASFANMNRVDKFDQLKKTYEIARKSHKWWYRIFFYFLDAAIVNAFILHKKVQDSNTTLKNFRLEIIDSLAAESMVLKRKTKGPSIEIKKRKPHVSLEIRRERVGSLINKRN
uniref:PiggyBac transposable element-derived protein domain-containing protein n=1 Tax=Octopus bimaculoides TaxID=37653 RepID=A0A0L8HJX7_OCTBM